MNIQKNSIERTVVWFTLLATVNIVTLHLIAIIVQRYLPEATVPVWWLTTGAVALSAAVSPFTSGIMPAWLDGSTRRHPFRAALFALLAVVALAQTARITANRINPEKGITVLTSNEFWTAHECGTAYFHACELHDRGEENIYHADHYPVLNRNIEPHTEFEGMKVEDSYQYPPQFLLLPKTLLLFTRHYPTLRYVWFAMQFLFSIAVFLAVARWIGGTAGRWMAMLSPLVILSPAALYAYQYTQFHFLAIVMAMAAMLAFAKNRNAVGGALLAFAIAGKIFPGFLAVLLLMQKRWKPLAWTAGFGVLYTVAALAVLGLAPFSAFIGYQLPRLQSFAAFAFLETWPEVRFELITANLSPYGQIIRLGELGIPGMTAGFASVANSVFTVLLLAGIACAARRIRTKADQTRIWLGILGLASMASPAAWGDYIPLPALWLLTLLPKEVAGQHVHTAVCGVCWIFFYFLIGTVPTGGFPSPAITYGLSTLGFSLLVCVQGWILVRRRPINASSPETNSMLSLSGITA